MNAFEETGPPVEIYDNGGRTFDRYTVFFPGEDLGALGIGKTGNVPRGFCMWVEAIRPGNDDPDGIGCKISFEELPESVKKAILDEWCMW